MRGKIIRHWTGPALLNEVILTQFWTSPAQLALPKQKNYVFYVKERTWDQIWDRIGIIYRPILEQVSEDVDER